MNLKESKIKSNKVTLAEEQIHFYDEQGYLMVPRVFEEEVCDAIKQVAEGYAEADHSVILNIHRQASLFMELMKDPVLILIVKAVQRHKVVGLNDQYLFKNPGTPYAKQSWNPHQDNAYARAPKDTYLQLHIFLDASDKENGGLFYYPGSHQEDILPYEYVKSWKEEFDENGISHPGWKILEIPSPYKKVDVVGPKGGICLQNGNLIHGSYPNFSQTRSRHQYSVAYLNEGEKFMEGSTSVRIPIPVE